MKRCLSVVSLVVALFSVACGSTEPKVNIYGTYTLKTVNGSSLPAVIYQDLSGKIEITDGSFTLKSDNTFTDFGTFRVTQSGSTQSTAVGGGGTFSRNGNDVTFIYSDGSSNDYGSLSGNTLTVSTTTDNTHVTLVLQK